MQLLVQTQCSASLFCPLGEHIDEAMLAESTEIAQVAQASGKTSINSAEEPESWSGARAAQNLDELSQTLELIRNAAVRCVAQLAGLQSTLGIQTGPLDYKQCHWLAGSQTLPKERSLPTGGEIPPPPQRPCPGAAPPPPPPPPPPPRANFIVHDLPPPPPLPPRRQTPAEWLGDSPIVNTKPFKAPPPLPPSPRELWYC